MQVEMASLGERERDIQPSLPRSTKNMGNIQLNGDRLGFFLASQGTKIYRNFTICLYNCYKIVAIII